MTQNINLTIPVIEKISSGSWSWGWATPGGDNSPIQQRDQYLVATQPENKKGTFVNHKDGISSKSVPGMNGVSAFSFNTTEWVSVCGNTNRPSHNTQNAYEIANGENVVTAQSDLWVEKLNSSITGNFFYGFKKEDFEITTYNNFIYDLENEENITQSWDFEHWSLVQTIANGDVILRWEENGELYTTKKVDNTIEIYQWDWYEYQKTNEIVMEHPFRIIWPYINESRMVSNASWWRFSRVDYYYNIYKLNFSTWTLENLKTFHDFSQKSDWSWQSQYYSEWGIRTWIIIYNNKILFCDAIEYVNDSGFPNSAIKYSLYNSSTWVFRDDIVFSWDTDNRSIAFQSEFISDSTRTIWWIDSRANNQRMWFNFETETSVYDKQDTDWRITTKDFYQWITLPNNKYRFVDDCEWWNYLFVNHVINRLEDEISSQKICEFILDWDTIFSISKNDPFTTSWKEIFNQWWTYETLSNQVSFFSNGAYTKNDFSQTQTTLTASIKSNLPKAYGVMQNDVSIIKY